MTDNDIRGTVTDETGNPIEGAVVALIPDEESGGDNALYTTTDANGEYLFGAHPQGDGTTQQWHIVAQYQDGGGSYNTLSRPNVSAALPEGGLIPDSVEYQVAAEDFASPWPFSIGNTEMSVSGLTESNGLVSGDGDHGTADGPQNHAAGRSSFGVALSLGFDALGDYQAFCGALQNNARFVIWENLNGADGSVGIQLRDDNDTRYTVSTSSGYGDNTVRPVVINKPDDDPNNLNIYVGDMSTSVGIDVISDGGYDSNNHTSRTREMGFYAENQSSPSFSADADIGVFEFNADQYSKAEREEFATRRPEL